MTRFFGGVRPGGSRRWWRRFRFGDVVLISILPLIAAGYLLATAAAEHRQARRFDDWWSRTRTVPLTFAARLGWMKRFPRALILDRRFDPETDDPGVLQLLVPRSEWDAIMVDPLQGFGQWVEGMVDDAGRLDPVRIRKRGDTSVHWTTPKVSFTLRTPKRSLYRGHRTMAFSGRDVVTTYVANALTQHFDLLAPETWLAPVFLNKRYYGLFRGIEPADESFLRRHGRMPGTIYRGDAAERGEYFKGVPRSLFVNPAIWEQPTLNDRPGAAPANAMDALLADIHAGTLAAHRRIMTRVDRAEVARLVALLLLVGDPYHMDDVHNQLWYEDPATALLHPVPWDLRLLDLRQPTARSTWPGAQGPELRINAFLQAALRDPFLVADVLSILEQFIADDTIISIADSLADEAVERFGGYIEFDQLRHGVIPSVRSVEDVRLLIRGNAQLLETWLADAAVVLGEGGTDSLVLDFETRGYAGLNLTALEFVAAHGNPVVYRDGNRNGVLDSEDPRVEGESAHSEDVIRFVPARPEALLSGWNTTQQVIAPGRIHYRYFVTGLTDHGGTRPVMRNRLSGEVVVPDEWSSGNQVSATRSWHPWQLTERIPVVHRWAGNIHLRSTAHLAPGDTLVIAPGTTVRLDPDVSVVVRGPVFAEGTAARPILFSPADDDLPWGAFALQGPEASGSRLEHVRFVAGGGALVDRVEYIGMVNVHGASNVVLSDMIFEHNVRSDDTFHALHAEVHLLNSRFVSANGDAVDFDYAGGTITGNTFEDSGGDAIDLMSSHPRIEGNRVWRSADKGISIGERSTPFVTDNVLADGDIGIEIKDRSEPLIVGNRIAGNRVGIKLSRKNWRYGSGGWGKMDSNVMEDNTTPIESDDRSRVTTGPPPPHRPPTWEAAYRADFQSARDGWMASGTARRLEKRDDALVLVTRHGLAVMTLPVDWVVEDDSGLVVLELGAHALEEIRIVVESADGHVEMFPVLEADSSRFQFVHVPLPPGRYGSLRLEATAESLARTQRNTGLLTLPSGLLRLRSVRWYGRAGGERTTPSPGGE